MNKINLTLAIHNHQPVGNFEHVIEQNFRQSYEPFIAALEKHPQVRVAIHYTGFLWEFIRANHPDFIEKLHNLAARNQVEMLGGAFYEAILTVLPERDAVAQQALLKKEMQDFSGREVDGMWLAERIWEPGMPHILCQGGYRYTFLDESHFHAAGLKSDDIWGLFRTEDRGETTLIFPIDKTLRYYIPFQLPERTMEFLESRRQQGVTLLTYGDDGEKFGSWPDTYKWVYQDGWLENFLTQLENNPNVEILLPREAAELHSSRKDIYLPCASYEEMGEWTLPADSQVELHHLKDELKHHSLDAKIIPWFRGGFWRQFLAKYPESGRIYRRMLRVSDKVAALQRKKNVLAKKVELAQHSLLRGQANDAYWHGVFGGVYLPHLRSAIQKELIIAETICDREISKASTADIYEKDAVILENEHLRLQLHPHQGGGIASFDLRKVGLNLADTFSRCREPYHTRMLEKQEEKSDEHASIHDRLVIKEKNLEEKLAVDNHQRFCFIDRILKPGFTGDDIQYNRNVEAGAFLNAKYNIGRQTAKEVDFSCEGKVDDRSVFIAKLFNLYSQKASLTVRYLLEGDLDKLQGFSFAPELNLNLMAPNASDRFFLVNGERFPGNNLGSFGDRNDIRQFSLVDDWLGVRVDIETSLQARWIWRPVETISLSEEGIERVYQGSMILPIFDLSHLQGKELTVTLNFQYWKPIL